MSGQDEPNLALWLATRAGKMERSYLARSGYGLWSARKLIMFGVSSHIINPLLTKLVRSRWLDVTNKELGQYPPFSLLRNLIILCKRCYQKFRDEILLTTSSHSTLMADGVQWLSQSDCSIRISILVEFSKNSIETKNLHELLTLWWREQRKFTFWWK